MSQPVPAVAIVLCVGVVVVIFIPKILYWIVGILVVLFVLLSSGI